MKVKMQIFIKESDWFEGIGSEKLTFDPWIPNDPFSQSATHNNII
jgi:hypothetical protein